MMVTDNREVVIHEVALATLARIFNKEDRSLKAEIRKDGLVLYDKYKSSNFSLFRFHGATYGIKEKDEMPPQVKFTIDPNKYNIEFNMKGDGDENTITFREKLNEENYIYLKVT